jgi:pentatricopeptide repeat protein
MSSGLQVTFNSLMTACLNGGSGLDEALCVLDDMEAAGFSSDVVTYNILIGACSRFGWLEEREDLLVDMKAAGIKPNDITYKMLALHRPDDQERGFRKRLEVYPVQVQVRDGVVKRRRKRSH